MEVIYEASKDWLCLTGSFDFNASDETAAIFGPIEESACSDTHEQI